MIKILSRLRSALDVPVLLASLKVQESLIKQLRRENEAKDEILAQVKDAQAKRAQNRVTDAEMLRRITALATEHKSTLKENVELRQELDEWRSGKRSAAPTFGDPIIGVPSIAVEVRADDGLARSGPKVPVTVGGPDGGSDAPQPVGPDSFGGSDFPDFGTGDGRTQW